MHRYNHSVGLKMVGEVLPYEHNRVTLTQERDQYGLPIPRVTFSYGDNERAMIEHALDFMDRSLEARSEEHTSELQSLMRTSYADFCLQKIILSKTQHQCNPQQHNHNPDTPIYTRPHT